MAASRKRLVGMILAVTLALAACGQSAGSPTTTASKETTTAKAGTETPTDKTSSPEKSEAPQETSSALSNPSERNSVYPIEGDHELSYWVPLAALPRETIQSLSENLAYMAKAEATGVKINFIHPPAGEGRQAFDLMLNADTLPDIVERVKQFYPGGIDHAIDEGYFIRLNELAEEYAPNYMRIINSDPEVRREAYTDSGNLMGFGMICTEQEGMDLTVNRGTPFLGPQINKDWLDELNLEVPKTIEDWDEMLGRFKEKEPEGWPLMIWGGARFGGNGLMEMSGTFVSAYDIGPLFFLRDGKILFGPATPEYKDYLLLMANWYEKGYINDDFSSMDVARARTFYLNDKCGSFVQGTRTALELKNQGITYIGAQNPKLVDGPDVHWSYRNNLIRGFYTLISDSCKIPEVAVQWLDWNYTKDGYIAFNFGIEGESFLSIDEETGRPDYVAGIKDNNYANFHRLNNVFHLRIGSYLKSDLRSNPRRFIPEMEQDIREVWELSDTSYVLPPITLTAEEGEEYAEIMTNLNTYREENTIKFITGALDIEAGFDKYLETMENYNVARACELQEEALARYNAR
ncbi:MAG: extracellular solute-binding protein [Bacillota bacterium]|nr:extracellular solute-binding protein [Bacillota bacterium]